MQNIRRLLQRPFLSDNNNMYLRLNQNMFLANNCGNHCKKKNLGAYTFLLNIVSPTHVKLN